MCISGVDVPVASMNASNRCVDGVSTIAYQHDTYHQWPDHCIQGGFGSMIDPYLMCVPSFAVHHTHE
jgi:hypothetical protein